MQSVRITSVRLRSGFNISLCSSKQPYVRILLITKLKRANREYSFGRFERTHSRMFIFIDISHDGPCNYVIQRLQSKCLSKEKCYRDQVNWHVEITSMRITSFSIVLNERRKCNKRLCKFSPLTLSYFVTRVFARAFACTRINDENDSSFDVWQIKRLLYYSPRYQDTLLPAKSDLLHKLMPQLGQCGSSAKIVCAVCRDDR